MNILDKIQVERILIKGTNIIEIWDSNQKIKRIFKTLEIKKGVIWNGIDIGIYDN